MRNSPSDSNPPIHILDDDSLLNIFYLYQPAVPVDVDIESRPGTFSPPRWGEWSRERWWHKLSHVCQRWRRLIFASASYLGLCLVCTYGTPVARMLECSPALPIVLDYAHQTRRWTVADEEGILLALQHRARVRCIRLFVPRLREGKLFMAIETEFPVLEYLYVGISSLMEVRPGLEIPHSFQALHLCHLALSRCSFLVASPSLMTSAGLVTLSLKFLPLQSRHHAYDLFRQLSHLSQLVVLRIAVADGFSTDESEEEQLDIPFITHFTLPNLRLFEFAGHTNYLETLLPWMTTPLLEKLQIIFLPYLTIPNPTYTLPGLLQYMSKVDVLGFGSAKFVFNLDRATVWVYPREGARVCVFYLRIINKPFGLQVSDMARIFEGLSPIFSTVVDLTLDYSDHNLTYDGPRPVQWRNLLGSFNHVKTLRVHGIFAENFSRSLLSDGEPLPEVLPELQVLECPVGCDGSDAFATFVNVRKAAGYPIRLILVDSPGRSSTSTGM